MKLKSQILTSSKTFQDNMREHLKNIEKITEIAKKNSLGGSQFSRDRHSKRGKMLPRDRVSGLLDIGCLLYTSPSPRDATLSRMPSSA